MKTNRNSILALVLVLVLAACSQKKPENVAVPIDVVDQNQTISRENAQLNAKRFINIRFPQADNVTIDSDSTISSTCRNGDGWASGKVWANGAKIADIKCQTNGHGKGIEGCLTLEDFKSKDYAKEDGVCQDLPKLDKFIK